MAEPTSRTNSNGDVQPSKAPWQPPRIAELPRLTELTLLTGSGIPGGGTGGTTVF